MNRRLLAAVLTLLGASALVLGLRFRGAPSTPASGLPSRPWIDEPAAGPLSWSVSPGATEVRLHLTVGGRSRSLRSGNLGATFSPSEETPAPPLPPGVSPVPLGSLALRGSSGPVAVGRDSEGRGVLLYGGTTQLRREAPAGELVAAFQEGGPRLLLKRKAGTGFVELVLASVPGEDGPWGAESSAEVSYVSELAMPSGPERSCGLPDERYASLVGVGTKDAALIAVGPKAIHAYRFHATPGARYSVVCGSCPPMVLESRNDGLGLFVPVRRNLSPARIAVPPTFEPGRSDRSAVGACTMSRTAVIYEAGGKLLVQEREAGSWRFGAPRVVAETDARGAPIEPALLGVGDALVAVWRRKIEGRLLLEAATL